MKTILILVALAICVVICGCTIDCPTCPNPQPPIICPCDPVWPDTIPEPPPVWK